jgi:iron(III) transport system permease protein
MKKVPVFWMILLVVLAVLLLVFLYFPVGFILRQAFFPGGRFSLAFFTIIAGHSLVTASILNSMLLAVTVTTACVAVSLPLAWYATRYRFRGQGLLTGFMMLPMVLPPFVGAIGMKQFLSRFGTLNLLLLKTGIIDTPVDWLGSGFWGVVILEVLHLFPIVYLNLSASLANIDPSLEEAAWNLGSGTSRFARKILFPLAAPGLFAGCAIVFIWSMTDLGTPLILEYRSVAAYQIYSMINDIHENPMGYALVLFMLAWVALMYFTSRMFFLGHGIQGSSRASRAVVRPRLHGWRVVLVLGLFLLIGLAALVPHIMVVISSLAQKWFMTMLPEHISLEYYHSALSHPLTITSIRNSLFLSSLATLLDIVLGVMGAYAIARYRFWGRALLDFSIMLPLALPGLILAFGYVGAFAGTPLNPRIDPFPLLVAAYSVRRLPFMVRALDAGLRQVAPSMEEAALNLGASHGTTLVKVTLPLISPNIMAGGILVFAFAMLEVSDSLILAMKENYYPLTKAIYALVNRIGDGFPVASTLGVVSMILLAGSMLLAGRILGKKMGELFRI